MLAASSAASGRGRARRRRRVSRWAEASASAPQSRSRSFRPRRAGRLLGASFSVGRPGRTDFENTSRVAGAIASTTLSAQTGSRKCCPKRFRVLVMPSPGPTLRPKGHGRRNDPRSGFSRTFSFFSKRLFGRNHIRRERRTARRAASVCRCGGRAKSTCRSFRPFGAGQRAQSWAPPRSDHRMLRCRSGSTREARADDRQPGTPRAWPSTTFAVFRPTPGNSTRASIVSGTSPP